MSEHNRTTHDRLRVYVRRYMLEERGRKKKNVFGRGLSAQIEDAKRSHNHLLFFRFRYLYLLLVGTARQRTEVIILGCQLS